MESYVIHSHRLDREWEPIILCVHLLKYKMIQEGEQKAVKNNDGNQCCVKKTDETVGISSIAEACAI